jgi:hypothetical protein
MTPHALRAAGETTERRRSRSDGAGAAARNR